MADKKQSSSQKKQSTLGRWINRLFYPSKELDIYAEERLQSPGRVVARNFFSKPLAVVSLVILILIMLVVFIGPSFVKLDLSEQDSTLTNVAPGYALSNYASELNNDNCAEISVGSNYAVGLDKEGNVYIWGQTKINKNTDLKNIPEEVLNANIVHIAAGYDHVVAVDDKGAVYAWGNDRLGQTRIPSELDSNNRLHKFGIDKVYASNQYSAVVTDDHRLILWGNANMVDMTYNEEKFDGHIVDVALCTDCYVVLLDDGSVVYAGKNPQSAVTKAIPADLDSGVKMLASSSRSAIAIKEDGTVRVWGAANKGESFVPQFNAPIVSVSGGRYHYTALLEDGSVVSWGNNRYKQTDVPENLSEGTKAVFTGMFQNYAVKENGDVEVWGLKGFLMGTDNLGRDVFARLINGGKMTMTIGALSVVIETIIGILLGGLAGYFGGKVDIILSRLAEVVSSLPFIPFAMILSAVMGTMVSIEQRMYIIMVILGILSWPGLFRLVRAQMFAQREMEYVTAAKALGVKESVIIFKHIIPNVMSVVLVSITLAFGTAMLTESSLSYLGFGIPLPTPTWGNMLSNANNSVIIQNYWWNWVFVGAIFGIACICINLIGDGLRDALDPKSSER